jgi:PEP-CTERM motif
MKLQRLLLVSLFVVVISSMSFAGIINPISASADLSMSADAGCGPNPSPPAYQDWITNPPALNTLMSSATAIAQCSSPNRKVTTSGDLEATWTANTKKGKIIFKNIGWTVNANVTSGSANADLGSDYTYTFMPTTEIQFDMTYDISANNNNTSNFGLNGFYINLTGSNWGGLYGVGSSGTLSAILWPNQIYTLTIENGANISGFLAGAKEHMDGKFNWVATPVPEPTSMLLMGSGILALAGALRKKMSR